MIGIGHRMAHSEYYSALIQAIGRPATTPSIALIAGASLLMVTPNVGLVISPLLSEHLSTDTILSLVDEDTSIIHFGLNHQIFADRNISPIELQEKLPELQKEFDLNDDINIVLIKVDKDTKDKLQTLAQGEEIGQTLTSLVKGNQAETAYPHLCMLATKEEADSGQLPIESLFEAKKALIEYERIKSKLNRDVLKAQTNPDYLSGLLSLLDTAANIVEVGGALAWATKKIVEKYKKRHGRKNTLVQQHIEIIERIADFFIKEPKARIGEISSATDIPKEQMRLLLKGLKFEHEPDCFWHPPQIETKLLTRVTKTASRKRIFRKVGMVLLWILGIGTPIALLTWAVIISPLIAKIVAIGSIPFLLLLLFLIVAKLIGFDKLKPDL